MDGTISDGVANNKMTESTNKTEEEKKEGVPGYTSTKVGDHTVITPDDKKASVYQKVTPREQYAVARDVANRAINEINAIRSRRPSSFTGGINDANIAARMQAAETYGDTLPGGSGYSRSRKAAYDIADSYRNLLTTAPKPSRDNPPVFISKPVTTKPTPVPTKKKPVIDTITTKIPLDTTPEEEVFKTIWKPTSNYDGGGYVPGQFGRGPEYEKYEQLFAKSIAEGFTLEEAMKISKTATSYDWEQAFGSADQWKKTGGGSRRKGAGSKSGKSMSGKKGGISGKRGQGKTKCDIRLKTDIAPLMSTEINDDLAELAFFVKELRVK